MGLDTQGKHEGLWVDSPSSITVTSGDRLDPMAIRVEDIHIADIAHSIARQCRYNGHVGGYLSVARHSLWVAERIETTFVRRYEPSLVMTALLHDASEAYLGDLVRPLKHTKFGQSYLAAEDDVECVLALRFDLPYPFPAEIAAADNWVLMERELGGELARWTWSSTPDEDEQAFLLAYRRLVGERREQ